MGHLFRVSGLKEAPLGKYMTGSNPQEPLSQEGLDPQEDLLATHMAETGSRVAEPEPSNFASDL